MRLFKKLKENNKGFTLIEIIVVIAIMAILAAVAIPTMNGFVEEAKDQKYIAEARAIYVAAQFHAVKDQGTSGDVLPDEDDIASTAAVGGDFVITMGKDTTGEDPTEVLKVEYYPAGDGDGKLVTIDYEAGTTVVGEGTTPGSSSVKRAS